MRLQLQQITQEALREKEENHKKLVKEHLQKLCSETANKGFYEVPIKFGCLSDGLPLLGTEVNEYAESSEHPLTYTPPSKEKHATLSWYPEIIIGKSVIE